MKSTNDHKRGLARPLRIYMYVRSVYDDVHIHCMFESENRDTCCPNRPILAGKGDIEGTRCQLRDAIAVNRAAMA
jgi:hypothetical protein